VTEEIPTVHLLKAELPVILYEYADRSVAERKANDLEDTANQYGLFYSARKDGENYELSEEEFATSKRLGTVCRVPLQPMRVFAEAIIAKEGLCAAVIMHRYEVLGVIYAVGFSIDSARCVVSDEVD